MPKNYGLQGEHSIAEDYISLGVRIVDQILKERRTHERRARAP